MLHSENSHFQCNEEKFMSKMHCAVCALHSAALCMDLFRSFCWHEASERRLRISTANMHHMRNFAYRRTEVNEFAQHSHWTDPIYLNGFWSILAKMKIYICLFGRFALRERTTIFTKQTNNCCTLRCLGPWTPTLSSSSPWHSWHISSEDDVHVGNFRTKNRNKSNDWEWKAIKCVHALVVFAVAVDPLCHFGFFFFPMASKNNTHLKMRMRWSHMILSRIQFF